MVILIAGVAGFIDAHFLEKIAHQENGISVIDKDVTCRSTLTLLDLSRKFHIKQFIFG